MAINLMDEVKGATSLASQRFNNRERTILAQTSGPARMLTASYSFATQGGAVGDIELKDEDGLSMVIPANACITRLWTDVKTSFTSGGSATVAIAASSTVLLAATAYNSAALTGFDAQSLTAVKLSSASTLKITVATAALTAGVMRVFIEYIQSDV